MPEASPFLIPLSLPLSRSQLDRAAHLRSDQGALDELWAKGKIIDLLGDRFRIDGAKLALLTSAQIDELEKQSEGVERYFLGLDSNKVAYFAAHRGDAPSEYPSGYESLRTIGKSLSDLEIGAAVHALALSLWHQSHRRCAKCGAETKSNLGGSVRKCLSCEADHHPRTDPAVIVLVKDKSDRILLGRQRVWPPKRFSTFAGFVEPGESCERTVVREVAEE
ncbi:MAG: NAD(+) diphosphatase, partial [Actinomycetota bacterium]